MAHEIYLRINTDSNSELKGECFEQAHLGWIVLDEFNFSVTGSSENYRSSGGPELSPISINKHIDKASPKLALATCMRSKFLKAQIDICQASSNEASTRILSVYLGGVIPVKYELNGEDNSKDSFDLLYETIKFEYQQINPFTFDPGDKIITHWSVLKSMGG